MGTHSMGTQTGHTDRAHKQGTQTGHTDRAHKQGTQTGHTNRAHKQGALPGAQGSGAVKSTFSGLISRWMMPMQCSAWAWGRERSHQSNCEVRVAFDVVFTAVVVGGCGF